MSGKWQDQTRLIQGPCIHVAHIGDAGPRALYCLTCLYVESVKREAIRKWERQSVCVSGCAAAPSGVFVVASYQRVLALFGLIYLYSSINLSG